jgi:hypothetical protein
MFVTFIYRISGDPTPRFGKFWSNWFNDDHQGFDAEMKTVLVNGLNRHRSRTGMGVLPENDVKVGILAVCFNNEISIYSTDEEIFAFDFYHKDYGYSSDGSQTYLQGVLVP